MKLYFKANHCVVDFNIRNLFKGYSGIDTTGHHIRSFGPFTFRFWDIGMFNAHKHLGARRFK